MGRSERTEGERAASRLARSAVFRADAGAAGLGHVSRCAALAEHLAAIGWTCHLVAPMPPSAPLDLGMFATVSAPSADETASIPPSNARARHDILVVDHYDLGERYETGARDRASAILVFDDLADRRHDADMLVDFADAARAAAYRSLVPESCTVLAGPDYAPLRARVLAARETSIRRRGGPVARLLVSIGSGNTAELVRTVVEQARRAGPECAIDVVAGTGAEGQVAQGSVTVHLTNDKMIDLMSAADAAIGAGGVAAWERSALGLPSVVVVTAPNQRQVAAALRANDAALVVGLDEPVAAAALGSAIKRLIEDGDLRLRLSRKSARLCDGLGASRLAALIDARLGTQLGIVTR